MKVAFRALLLAAPAVTALVPAARINWRRHPQGAAWPGIVLRVISDRDAYALATTTNMATARVQVDVWAESVAEAEAVAQAVRTALGGYRDATFARIELAGARDTHDPEALGDPAGVSMDFEIDYRRA